MSLSEARLDKSLMGESICLAPGPQLGRDRVSIRLIFFKKISLQQRMWKMEKIRKVITYNPQWFFLIAGSIGFLLYCYFVLGYGPVLILLLLSIFIIIGTFRFNFLKTLWPELPVIRITDDDWNEPCERDLVLDTSAQTAFERCLRSINVLGDSRIVLSDRDKGLIVARFPVRKRPIDWDMMNILRQSIISFEIRSGGDEKTHIRIKSVCSPEAMRPPAGMNRKLVETISTFLVSDHSG